MSKDSEISGFQEQLKKEKDRAEEESGRRNSEVANLKEMLSQKDEALIIAKYKSSPEYDEAIANAGAPEVMRCWLVAERDIKTDPGANWDSFVDKFLLAKENIEKGYGESEPFNGPSPAILPGPPPPESS